MSIKYEVEKHCSKYGRIIGDRYTEFDNVDDAIEFDKLQPYTRDAWTTINVLYEGKRRLKY